MFALTFLLPAWAGIVSLAPDSRLNLVGAALATIGVGAGVAINALTGLTLYVATDGKLGQGAGEAFMDRLWHGGVLPALFVAYLLLPVAALFATAGILRARAARWWESVLWSVGLVLLFLSAGGWMGAVASAILLAGSLLLARRLSRPPLS